MSYGTMDKATEDILRAADIDPEAILFEDEEGIALTLDIVFDGALDESFLIKRVDGYTAVVDAIADRLIADFPDNDVEVSTGEVYVGEDFIEGTGDAFHAYTRRSAEH